MAVGSFSAGLSGLNANSVYLNVIGNNLANINTIGFKSSAVTFMDLVSQTTGGSSINPMQVGLGVVTGSMSPVFNQGAIESTGEPTNAAIQGAGFFVVKSPDGAQFYTRAGNFSLNSEGVLISPDGYRVQGFSQIDPLTGDIITTGQPGDIVVPAGVLRDPIQTTRIQLQSNLDAGAVVGDTFDTPMQIFDSLGESHVVTITFTKTAGGWDWDMTVPGDEVAPVAALPVSIAAGALTFDGDGQVGELHARGPAVGGGSRARPSPTSTFDAPAWANGATSANITWDIVDDNDVVQLTGFASPSATASKSPERRRGRQDRQHQHQRGRVDRRHLRRRSDRVDRQDLDCQLQQPEGPREDGLEPLRREPGVGHPQRRARPAPAAAARSSARRSSSPTWTWRSSSRR